MKDKRFRVLKEKQYITATYERSGEPKLNTNKHDRDGYKKPYKIVVPRVVEPINKGKTPWATSEFKQITDDLRKFETIKQQKKKGTYKPKDKNKKFRTWAAKK